MIQRNTSLACSNNLITLICKLQTAWSVVQLLNRCTSVNWNTVYSVYILEPSCKLKEAEAQPEAEPKQNIAAHVQRGQM